jgi:hypothetical protein
MGHVLNRDCRALDADLPAPVADYAPTPGGKQLYEFANAVRQDQALTRAGIAQYLHDTLLQTLVVLSFTSAEPAAGGDSVDMGACQAELISRCCRQARVITALLATPFTGDGDVVGLIQLVLENMQQDAGIRVDFSSVSEPVLKGLPPEVSILVFDLVMEFVSVLVVERSTASQTILFTPFPGWITLDLPARWGDHGRTQSALSRVRIEALGGAIEGDGGDGRMRVRFPLELDEPSNSDCR